ILGSYAQLWIGSFHSNRPKRRWRTSKKDVQRARLSSRCDKRYLACAGASEHGLSPAHGGSPGSVRPARRRGRAFSSRNETHFKEIFLCLQSNGSKPPLPSFKKSAISLSPIARSAPRPACR